MPERPAPTIRTSTCEAAVAGSVEAAVGVLMGVLAA
jgi:hypothetical protein